MKYLITGSIGHISLPIIKGLKKAGHDVTVITSNREREKEIESLGAKAAVGSLEDSDFVKNSLAGADVAYLMIPPKWNLTGPWIDHQKTVADHYIQGLRSGSVKHVVMLSSVGAHLSEGVGPVDGLGYLENRLRELTNLNILILRPSYFYNNLLTMIPMIRNMNIAGSNFGSTDEKLILVHTDDIAEVATEELRGLRFKGHSVRYIASDERHPKEIASILGKAIGKDQLPWVEFKDSDALQGMLQMGLSTFIAEPYVALGRALREGKMQEDYWKNRPAILGKNKLEDFAKVFAAAYKA